MTHGTILYPYLPDGRQILYVSADNVHMRTAREFARRNSLDEVMPGAAVVVDANSRVIGTGANGSDYHKKQKCQRVILGCKSGQGYELCEGCHPKNHSEAKAIADTKHCGQSTVGADLYLWGHWWFCKSCWDCMIVSGIRNVYLLEQSHVLFNKAHPDNIIGRQFLET